ncbi:MAG: S41 family peptidase [Isosphaerales bacterium]
MKQPIRKTLICLIAVSAAIIVCSRAAIADQPSRAPSTPTPTPPPDLARRIGDITEAVLDHHIDPPARQQMILGGIKAVYKSAGLPVPLGLSRRVSALSTPDQLATLLVDIWPKSTAKSVAATKLEEVLFDGLLASVPGGARLISAKDRTVEEQFAGNRYVGIHIALMTDPQEKRPSMAEVFVGGPADRAGARPGDLIEQINGVDTKGMDLRDAVDRLRGDEGTDVTIKVRQPKESKSRTMKITRGQLPHGTISGVRKRSAGGWDIRLNGPDPIGYLRITQVRASTPHELRKLVRQIEGQGDWGLILDLRGLGGTSLHEAVLLADSLLAGGVIGRVQTAQREVTYRADSDALFGTSPIAVLVDQNTSGTAEWLAAALQDNHRAVIVGTPTFSATYTTIAGVEQRTDLRSMVTIGDGSWSIELTTGQLQRGDGRPISGEARVPQAGVRGSFLGTPDPAKIKTGVKPDHIVGGTGTGTLRFAPPMREQRPDQEPSTANDKVLQEAVRLLRESLQKFI